MSNMSFEFSYPSQRSPLLARNIVSTSQPLAAQAGVQMLQKGGNAIDAVLAAAMVLVLVEPTGNGLGSDAFAIIWDGKKLQGLNASGRSPQGWTEERFAGRSKMPDRGWESVTVPGMVSAWVELSNKYGKLPFEELFKPAISYAKNGFPVSPVIATLWKERAAVVENQPGFRECFMPNGRSPHAGEFFASPEMARSLELIAKTKGEAFYRGELAEKIVAFSKKHNAALTMADLDAQKPDWCGTASVGFRDFQLHEIPPNGQGISALMALGILDHTDLASYAPDSIEAVHLQIEAMKIAFADTERYVADIDYMPFSVAEMTAADYLKKRAQEIDMDRAGTPHARPPRDSGTVYITAADESGMMVSYIQSNFNGFGSGVVIPGTGISMQNRGLSFTTEKGHPNCVGPSKRPFHTIIPGFIMRDNEPAMSFGVMGGPMQSQGHLQISLRTQLWGQNPQLASDAPRWRALGGLKVAVESTMSPALIDGLKKRGHDIVIEKVDTAFGFGGAQIIQRIKGGYIAGSDHRKDGFAVGF